MIDQENGQLIVPDPTAPKPDHSLAAKVCLNLAEQAFKEGFDWLKKSKEHFLEYAKQVEGGEVVSGHGIKCSCNGCVDLRRSIADCWRELKKR